MKKRWNDRTKLWLKLELAIVLPAALLIGFNVYKLKSIHRDKAVEAAIQRDFSKMLHISERRIAEKAHGMVARVRARFPDPASNNMGEQLERILEDFPYAAHLFYYDEEHGSISRAQWKRMKERDFHDESEKLCSLMSTWMKAEGKELRSRLWKMEQKEVAPFFYFANLVPRGDKMQYQSVALFSLPTAEKDQVAIGGLAFDSEYLRDTFFPEMLNGLLAQDLPAKGTANHNHYPAVMMVHVKREATALAASAGWDGGKPEVERNIEDAFPGLTLAIKYRGTTIEALSLHFLVTSFAIVGALSLLLAGGILLTYRNVSREMELARLKSDFVANVSHELRTPLALIRLYAETLEMGRLTDPQKYHSYYSIIRKESERLSALINNILDFSRIEAGRKEYSFRETNLAELVRNTLEAYRFHVEQQGFCLQQQIAEDLPPVRVDREAIARSVVNLVNNALKYSKDEKFLGINLYRSNGAVHLEVIDRGIGIPAAEQPKIFEKFYRVGDPLVHNTKGSGLGLSLVRHIVQAHGGQVWVESTPGKGSKFTVALPVTGAGAAAAAN